MDKIFERFCQLSLIIVIAVILTSTVKDISFRMKYSSPSVSSYSNTQIETANNPIQINLNGKDYIKVNGEVGIYVLKLQAEYSISGLVVAKNSNFWLRGLMRNKFDDVCLLDLGIVWGDLAVDKRLLYKNIKFKSVKTLGEMRQLQPKCKKHYCKDFPWSMNYFNTHLSHTHLIPANSNVMSALLTIKENDIVKLDGYLVDIYTDKSEVIAKTSLSRTDTNPTSRGYGACEDMYVTKVQIGYKIYL